MNIKKPTPRFFILGILILFGFIIIYTNNSIYSSTTSYAQSSDNIIHLNAIATSNGYVWESNQGINPSIAIQTQTDNVIIVSSIPNDPAQHKLIIQTFTGEEIDTSEVISDGDSTDLFFHPTGKGNLEYICMFHPQSMHGTINVS